MLNRVTDPLAFAALNQLAARVDNTPRIIHAGDMFYVRLGSVLGAHHDINAAVFDVVCRVHMQLMLTALGRPALAMLVTS